MGLEPRLGPRTFGLGLSAITQMLTSFHLGAARMASRGDQRAVFPGILRGGSGCLWLLDLSLSVCFAPAHVPRLAVLIHNYVSKDQYSLHRMNSKSWGSTTNLARA